MQNDVLQLFRNRFKIDISSFQPTGEELVGLTRHKLEVRYYYPKTFKVTTVLIIN